MVFTHKILTDKIVLSSFAAKINTAFQKRHILPMFFMGEVCLFCF